MHLDRLASFYEKKEKKKEIRQSQNFWVKKNFLLLKFVCFIYRIGEGNGTGVEKDGEKVKKIKKFAKSNGKGKEKKSALSTIFFYPWFLP